MTETLVAPIPRLTVSRIDPIAEARRYREETYASKAAGLDAGHRALLHQELQSPCYDEIAFFVAFSKIVRTGRPRSASATAIEAAMVVLPTPPLPITMTNP